MRSWSCCWGRTSTERRKGRVEKDIEGEETRTLFTRVLLEPLSVHLLLVMRFLMTIFSTHAVRKMDGAKRGEMLRTSGKTEFFYGKEKMGQVFWTKRLEF